MTTFYSKKTVLRDEDLVFFVCDTCGAGVPDGGTALHDGFHERLHMIAAALFPNEEE